MQRAPVAVIVLGEQRSAHDPNRSQRGGSSVSAARADGDRKRVAESEMCPLRRLGADHHLVDLWLHGRSPHTQRAYREDVRDQLIDGIKRRVTGLAQAHRAPAPSVEVREGIPPTINTPGLVNQIVPALARALGESNVKEVGPVMGAEDFGLFGRKADAADRIPRPSAGRVLRWRE